MQPGSRPLDALAISLALVLGLSWGMNQVAIKFALADWPPLTQAALRSAGAAVLIFGWAIWSRVDLRIDRATLVPGLWCGVLFGLEFVLFYLAVPLTTASRGVLFIYTAPFFVALGAVWFLPGERLRSWQWLGLALCFVGVAVALGVPAPPETPQALVGDLMFIVAAALWGATTLVIKGSALARAPFAQVLLYQLVVSVPILAVGALALGEAWPTAPSFGPTAWLVYQAVWVVAITYLVWFWLIQRYNASSLSAFTFVAPVSGVAYGHLMLGEAITPMFAAAVALVVAGLVLVNRR